MELFLISRPEGAKAGYDEFEAAVVVAEDRESARLIHPALKSHWVVWNNGRWMNSAWQNEGDTWIPPEFVEVLWLGQADADIKERKVILNSMREG